MDDEALRAALRAIGDADEAVRNYVANYGPILADAARRQSETIQATAQAQQAMARIEESMRAAEAFAAYAIPVLPQLDQSAIRAMADLEAFAQRSVEVERRLRGRLPPVVLDLDVDDFDKAAMIAEDEGVTLAWVPRIEIVKALIALPDRTARIAHLESLKEEVIEDCRQLATSHPAFWMPECAEAAETLADGHPAAAQSLAANIIDTIVRHIGGHAKVMTDAKAPLDDDAPFIALGELFAIKPIIKAMVPFWPNTGQALPNHFSRHSTAHAMGHSGVSSSMNALIAIMLATALARQFGPPLGNPTPTP